MGIIGGQLGYKALRAIAPRTMEPLKRTAKSEKVVETKIEEFFGDLFFELIKNKTVIDYGCGAGHQSIEIAKKGAARVIGLEIQDHLLEEAKRYADKLGLGEQCVFQKSTDEKADIVISKDAFEHFEKPDEVLGIMSSMLNPDGYVLASFGPTWLHPYGGHLFSVFPWSHLIFTEQAQIRWRSDFKNDGATRFSEVAGGLNQITISKFEKIVDASPFFIEWMETVPIKGIALFRTKLLREIGSSIVRCKLQLENL